MYISGNFLEQVEVFLSQWGYTDSEFGRAAMGDPNFLTLLRKGERSPTLRTVDRVREFMSGGEAKHALAVRRGAAPKELAAWETEVAKPKGKTGRKVGRPRKVTPPKAPGKRGRPRKHPVTQISA
jgi:hypothetical protein